MNQSSKIVLILSLLIFISSIVILPVLGDDFNESDFENKTVVTNVSYDFLSIPGVTTSQGDMEIIMKLSPKYKNETNNENMPPMVMAMPTNNKISGLPPSYDARNYVASEVKNQYQWGTCWIHSAIGSAESSAIMKGYATQSIDLSEIQTDYFIRNRSNVTENLLIELESLFGLLNGDTIKMNNGIAWGSEGGNIREVMRQWISGIGIADDEGDLSSISFLPDPIAEKNRWLFPNLSAIENTYHLINCDIAYNEDEVKDLLRKKGAGTFGLYFDPNSENFNEVTHAYYYNGPNAINHEVMVVGWDDNYLRSNFVHDPGRDGAWLARNSWGDDYGDNGYFWISYNDVKIGAEGAGFFEVVPQGDTSSPYYYDSIYQYDGGIFNKNYPKSYSAPSITEKNVFNANTSATQKITAVAFETVNEKVSYTIKLVVNGATVYEKSSSSPLEYSGYHTIPISSDVYVNSGDVFEVWVILNGNMLQIPVDFTDTKGNITSISSASAGQSWYRIGNSATWEDVSKEGGNLRIKAFAENTDAPSSLTISGLDTVGIGKNIQLSAQCYPTTASSKVTWSSSNTAVATIDESGKVTGKSSGSTIITASSKANPSISASKTITVKPPVTAVNINYDSLFGWFDFSDTIQLIATCEPANAVQDVTWSSSNPNVATVDSNGKVTTHNDGEVQIIATAKDGSGVASAQKITVRNILWFTVIFKNEQITLGVGESYRLDSSGPVFTSATPTPEPVFASAPPSTKSVSSNPNELVIHTDSLATTATNHVDYHPPATNISGSDDNTTIEEPSDNSTEIDPELPLFASAEAPPVTAPPLTSSGDPEITWRSKNPSIATVTSDGLVTGVSKGTATVVGQIAGVDAMEFEIVVVDKGIILPMQSITITGLSSINMGNSITLYAHISPDSAKSDPIEWIISHPDMVSNIRYGTDGNGIQTISFTATKVGNITITAREENGSVVSEPFTLSIVSSTLPATSIEGFRLKGDISTTVGRTYYLTTEVIPSSAKNEPIGWDIVPIDGAAFTDKKEGWTKENTWPMLSFLPTAPGQLVITAHSKDGRGITSSERIVDIFLENPSVTLSGPSNVKEGDTVTITMHTNPDAMKYNGVTWRISNTGNVKNARDGRDKDDNPTLTFTVTKAGTITITATSDNDQIPVGTTSLTIEKSEATIDSIDISGNNRIFVGDKTYLTAVISPSTAPKGVYWTSSNSSIATITQAGVVTGISAGTVTIRATATDWSGKFSTYDVTILPSETTVESVTIFGIPLPIKVGEKLSFTAKTYPETAPNKAITWTSSNDDIAYVDANGVVIGKSAGDAYIRATSQDNPEAYDEVLIKVTNPPSGMVLISTKEEVYTSEHFRLTVVFTPADTLNTRINWNISNGPVTMFGSPIKNETLGSVEYEFSISNVGNTTLFVVSKDDASIKSNEITISVKKAAYYIYITSDITELPLGESVSLSSYAVGAGGDREYDIKWSSNNTAIATIDENGVVTGNKEGQVTISASAGGKTASKVLTVRKPIVEISTLDELVASIEKYADSTNMRTFLLTNTAPDAYMPTSGNGTYQGIEIKGNITIMPVPVAGEITLDAGGYGRLFTIANGGSLTLVGNGTSTLNLTGGNGDKGGAISIFGGNLILGSGANITGCSADIGGGIYISSGTLELSGGNISGCTATNGGAGIYVMSGGVLNVSGESIVTGNTNGNVSNNVYLSNDECLNLVDDFTGSIGISNPLSVGKFGNIVNGANGAENFVSDIEGYNAAKSDKNLVWKAKEYGITYMLYGGTNAIANPVTYTITSDAIVLENARKKGYTFENWYNSSVFTEENRIKSISAGSTGNKTFHANYTANTTAVTFIKENGTSNTQTFTYDAEAVATASADVKEGYTFTGWYDNSMVQVFKETGELNESATRYANESLWAYDGADLTLYVNYTATPYSITIVNVSGHGKVTVDKEIAIIDDHIEVTEQANTGYHFTGWNVTKDDGSKIAVTNNSFTMPASNVSISAEFEANTTVVTFTNESGTSSTQTFTYDTEAVATVSADVKEGYSFTGWYDNETILVFNETGTLNGSATRYANESLWAYDGAELTLYANYTAIPYAISIVNVSRNGTVTADKTSAIINDCINLTEHAGTGYHFVKWNVTKDDDSMITIVNNSFSMPASNVSVDAEFGANVTSVIFDYHGLDGKSTETYDFTFADYVVDKVPAYLKKAGYLFHWSTEDGNEISNTIYISNEGNWNYSGIESVITFTGNFTVNETILPVSLGSYSATFDGDNITAINEGQAKVSNVRLDEVNGVEGIVVFVANYSGLSPALPTSSGYTKIADIALFEINATIYSGTASINMTVTLADTNEKDLVRFWHYNGAGWDANALKSEIVAVNGNDVTYKVTTSSFSPFGITLESVTPQPSSDRSNQYRQTDNPYEHSEILPQTTIPSVTPIETQNPDGNQKPVEIPTISRVKPTPQNPRESPAPVVGLIAGLGIAALGLVRLRK